MAMLKPQNGSFSQKFTNYFRKRICTSSLVSDTWDQLALTAPINESSLLARVSALSFVQRTWGEGLGYN